MHCFRLAAKMFTLYWLCVTPLYAFSQQELSREISVKLYNPAALGLGSSTDTGGWTYTSLGSGQFAMTNAGVQIQLMLVSKPLFVASEHEIREFVEKNGLLFDANLQSLIYDLNPELDSISKIDRRSRVSLPVLRVGDSSDVSGTPAISLILDKTLKKQFGLDVDRFREKLAKQKHLAVDVSGNLTSIDNALSKIRRDVLPVSHDMLVEASEDVIALYGLVSMKHKNSDKFAKDVAAIKEDLLNRIDASQNGNPDAVVVVRTKKNGEELSNFTVCYKAVARYTPDDKCDYSFPRDSSPTVQVMSEAAYVFWAIKGSTKTAVSATRTIHVRRQDPDSLDVDLELK